MVEKSIGHLELTVAQMVKQLSKAYVSMIHSRAPLNRFPSVMLWGSPGVGKSQGIRQVAAEIAAQTGKRVEITDVRLLLFNPVDLRGIPTANQDKTLAVWLKPKIFQMDDSEDVVNILFLDEISAAPQSVQAAAYQITLDRTVGEHRLPDNCIVVAAGNRVTDRSVAFTMPKAFANRLCHINIVGDDSSWHNWAVGAGINRIVLGFLTQNPSWLMRFDPSGDHLSFPTPRSWEMVSNILNHVSENVAQVYPLVVGCIGDGAAYELRAWSEVYGKIPAVETVFDGTATDLPLRPESLMALTSSIVAHAAEHPEKAGIRNAVQYVERFPTEFRNRAFADLLNIAPIRKTLSGIPAYDDWFLRSGKDWDDYGL